MYLVFGNDYPQGFSLSAEGVKDEKSTFEESWVEFARSINSLSDEQVPNDETADIDHLESIGAHRGLIEAARRQCAIGQFNIAPNEDFRDSSPSWIFKNAIPIANDGCGNYALWMDGSWIDSLVLLVSHDPPEVVVLGKTPAEFFNAVGLHVTNSPTKNRHGIFHDYLEDWHCPTETASEVTHTSQDDCDVFDFNAANVGDSISLDFRGKHTIAQEPSRPGVLTLTDEDENVLAQIRRRNRVWIIGIVAMVAVIFCLFYVVLKQPIFSSVALTFCSLITGGYVLTTVIDKILLWRAKRRGEP